MCTQADERAVAAMVAPDASVLLVLEALHRESAVLVHLTQARAHVYPAILNHAIVHPCYGGSPATGLDDGNPSGCKLGVCT